jgi:hypothetical protein
MKASVGPVAWTGSRFVAVSGGAAVLTFISSIDGVTWQQSPLALPGSLTHPGDVFLRGLAAGHDEAAAVGLTVTKVGASGDPNINAGMAWISSDGTNWTAVADPSFRPTRAGASIDLTAITPAAEGWIAVGEEVGPCNSEGCGLESARAAIWTSSDGLGWSRAPAVTALETAYMSGVAHGPAGYVGVGSAVDETVPPGEPGKTPTRGAVWTSRDGQAWSRVAEGRIPREAAGSGFGAVAAGPGGFIAIGTPSTGDGFTVLWSADGSSWWPAVGDFSGAGAPESIAVTPAGYLLVGYAPTPAVRRFLPTPSPAPTPVCPSFMWTSSDGRGFSCVANSPSDVSFKPGSGAASEDVEVLVGADSDGGAVWVRGLP